MHQDLAVLTLSENQLLLLVAGYVISGLLSAGIGFFALSRGKKKDGIVTALVGVASFVYGLYLLLSTSETVMIFPYVIIFPIIMIFRTIKDLRK